MKKRTLTIIAVISLLLISSLSAVARKYQVSGPQGGLSMKMELPDHFDVDNDHCQ